tara:strand:+ start:50 stop:625 length:576 start_codon:yes stop_codon:yes gene_type:complete
MTSKKMTPRKVVAVYDATSVGHTGDAEQLLHCDDGSWWWTGDADKKQWFEPAFKGLPPREDEATAHKTHPLAGWAALLRNDSPDAHHEIERLRSELERLKAMHDPNDAAVVTDAEPWQDRWSAAMAELRREMDRRTSAERLSKKYLADLRRVREAVAAFLRGNVNEGSRAELDGLIKADKDLRDINKEPMP